MLETEYVTADFPGTEESTVDIYKDITRAEVAFMVYVAKVGYQLLET